MKADDIQREIDRMTDNRKPNYMDTRLEHLMYQSGLTASGCWDQLDDYDRKAIEKFGELIVFECIKLAVFKGDATTGKTIKGHFGVEL